MTALQVQERVGKIILHFWLFARYPADGAGLCHKSIYFCAGEHATLDETKNSLKEQNTWICVSLPWFQFKTQCKKTSSFRTELKTRRHRTALQVLTPTDVPRYAMPLTSTHPSTHMHTHKRAINTHAATTTTTHNHYHHYHRHYYYYYYYYHCCY